MPEDSAIAGIWARIKKNVIDE